MSLLDTASLIVTPNGYKEGKLYSVIPSDGSGDLSVTRATTATRVNSAGLVELVPYNLLQYSEQFNNGYWTNFQSSVTANSIAAPNGTMTADTINQVGAGGGSVYVPSFSFISGLNTASCYFKAGTSNLAIIDSNGTGGYWGAQFDLANLTYILFGVASSANIENVGGGWFRCSVSANASGTRYAAFGIYQPATGLTAYIWGAQVNEGTAKDYQKTETRLNIPRLDYSNGTCPSLLVEPQRTNICLYSNDFTNAAWVKLTTTITPNYAVSPDGNMNASRVQFTAPSSQLYQAVGIQSSSVSSFYVKGISGETIAIYNSFNGGGLYELRTLTGEWQRIDVVSVGVINSYIAISNFFGATATDVLVYGAQFELGNYASSYIPTTSASVTRNADVISKTGISSLIGQTEGTILLDFVLKNPLSATNRIISITETNWLSGGSIRLDIDYNQIKADFVNGGSNIGSIIYSTTPLQNIRYKVAIAYKENDCQMYINGVDAGSDTTTGAMPTCSELYLNALGGGFNAPYEASNINAAALWKTRLTNTQLAQLTTI